MLRQNKVFAQPQLKFSPAFWGRRCRPPTAVGIDTYAERVCRRRRDWVSTPQSAKSSFGVFFFVAFSFAPSSSKEKAEWTLIFCFVCWLYLGFVRRGRRLRRPAKKYEETFLLSYFSVTKSTKSHQRERSPLFENSSRVHELVARAMRGKCVRQRIKQKSVVLPLPTISAIPRVRTYHTKKPSRFVHALPARPLKVHGGRGEVCALTEVTISLLQWEKGDHDSGG